MGLRWGVDMVDMGWRWAGDGVKMGLRWVIDYYNATSRMLLEVGLQMLCSVCLIFSYIL